MIRRSSAGSRWLCNARPLAGKQKSGISVSWPRPKLTSWENNSWESLEKKDSYRKNGGKNIQVKERETSLPCLSLGFGNDRRGMSESEDVTSLI